MLELPKIWSQVLFFFFSKFSPSQTSPRNVVLIHLGDESFIYSSSLGLPLLQASNSKIRWALDIITRMSPKHLWLSISKIKLMILLIPKFAHLCFLSQRTTPLPTPFLQAWSFGTVFKSSIISAPYSVHHWILSILPSRLLLNASISLHDLTTWACATWAITTSHLGMIDSSWLARPPDPHPTADLFYSAPERGIKDSLVVPPCRMKSKTCMTWGHWVFSLFCASSASSYAVPHPVTLRLLPLEAALSSASFLVFPLPEALPTSYPAPWLHPILQCPSLFSWPQGGSPCTRLQVHGLQWTSCLITTMQFCPSVWLAAPSVSEKMSHCFISST